MNLHRVDENLPGADELSLDDLKAWRASVGADPETGLYRTSEGNTHNNITNMAANLGIISHPGLSVATNIDFNDIANQIGYDDFNPNDPNSWNELENRLREIHDGSSSSSSEDYEEGYYGGEQNGQTYQSSASSQPAQGSSGSYSNRGSSNNPQNNGYRRNQYRKPNSANPQKPVTPKAPNAAANSAKEAAKTKAAAAKEGVKEAAKNAATAAKEGLKTLSKNPKFWIAVGIVALLLLLVILITTVIINSNANGGEYYDKFPYVKMNFSETVKVKINGTMHELTLDEATAAVLDHEDTPFTDQMEYLKARAIASRSRILYEMNQSSYKSKGYYESDTNLGFRITSKNSKFQKAADETTGVILISGSESNPSFYRSEWDSFTHKSSCGGSETSTSFILCQQKVEVPFSFLKKHFYYDIDWFRKRTGHGRGMSQHGAYYLASEKGYDAVKLLNLFYSGKTIISLYPHSNAQTENTPKINSECEAIKSISSTSSSAKKPTSALKTLLKNKGTSVSSFNDKMLNSILEAGSGTRCAVVTAAIYAIKNLSSYGYRIPYSQPGYSVTSYGISGNWGTKACSGCKYNIKGLDCGTFVQWAFYNGGVNLGFHQFKNKGKNVGYTDGKPGDVMYHSSTDGKNGHVVLILKYNKSKKGYYVAQAAGKSYGDTKISFMSVSFLKRSNYKVKDMSSYYCATSGCGKSKTKSNAQLKKAFK